MKVAPNSVRELPPCLGRFACDADDLERATLVVPWHPATSSVKPDVWAVSQRRKNPSRMMSGYRGGLPKICFFFHWKDRLRPHGSEIALP